MILYLLEHGHKISQIANETGLSTSTIHKYIKASRIDPETKAQAEQNKVSKEAMVIISELPHISPQHKTYILDQLLNGDIKLEQIMQKNCLQNIPKTHLNNCIDF